MYQAAHRDAVMIERADRRYVRVHGRDPVRMVQGLITNDIAGAAAEQRAVYAAVLTPKGKMVADVRVLRRGGELLLDVDAGAIENMTAHLGKFVPPLFARFETTDAWCCVGVYGVRAATLVAQCLGVDVGTLAEDDVANATLEDGDVAIVATSYCGVPGFDVILAASDRERMMRAFTDAGAVSAGNDLLELLRIEAGSPRWGAELDETTIPLEAGLRARAISESKGCYTGQEVIVRILHRGHVNWQLRGVLLGDAAVPERDTSLHDDTGKKVGRITSAVRSPAHGQVVALAYVRREVSPPAELRLAAPDGTAAHVVTLPFP